MEDPQQRQQEMRIVKDPLPDHASGFKEIPINALEVDEPPSHPRYHSGKVEIMRRFFESLIAGEEGDRTSSKLSKEVAPPPKKEKSRRSISPQVMTV